MAGDVFISYSRQDQEFVYRMVNDLEDRRADAWIDRGNIHGGQRWRESIESGIRACKAFVLVISPDSIASENVGEELALAMRLSRPIIPVVYQRASIPATLNAQLREWQMLDFTKGAYAQNLLDLVDALQSLGVGLAVDRAALLKRREQHLGARVPTNWGAVLSRVPAWAVAWAIGWGLLGLIVAAVILVTTSPNDPSPFLFLATSGGGMAGGFAGGLVAGFFTMFSLRHNAGSVRWKHISPAIRSWGIVGSIGVVAAGVVTFIVVEVPHVSTPCDAGLAECIGQTFVDALASVFTYVILLMIVLSLLVVLVVFLIGVVAGWLTVRRIRRVEPGIVGRQTFGVLFGWGIGAVVSAISTVIALIVIASLTTGSG